MTNMATSLTALLVLLALIPRSSSRIRSSSEERFLRSLDERDTVFYFGSSLADSVPEFQLVSLACPSTELHAEPWQCSLETQRGVFLLGVREGHLPLSCPPGEVGVLSATLGIWGVEPALCCGYPRVLHPPSSEGFLSICSGKMRGLLALGTERFYIQPVLQKHAHLTVDPGHDPAWTGDPHMVFLLPPSAPASPGFPLTPTHAHSEGRRERRSAGLPDVTHLELLVVVGPDVQQVHRQDTERYILTNLNIASELLRDKTLGANMRVHLVRMIILSEPEPEIRLSANITSTLRSVCDWGRRVNPSNDTDPLHADVLLYITRFDLVLPNGNNQVRGVAQLGGACSSDWNCVITEDTGFDLGITIAHEIGHSFGINHDGSDNTCGRSGFMMASDGGYNSVDLTWSACSRQQLHTFFREGKAECVKDLPVLEGSLQDWKPGLYYGVDDQCRIAFGDTARACSFSNPDLPVCRVLSCHVIPGDKSSCKRLLVPLLDGTECAPNQWCLKGLCVSPEDVGSSEVVHGSWSSWSELSTCSRTCGGGVQHRTRFCNNPRPAFGGRDCEGKDTEAGLCHQQACESTQLDFMAEQCSLTDPQPLSLSPGTSNLYTWIPALGFVTGDEQCKFMCQSEGENFIVSRGSQFVDGTRCEADLQAPLGSTPACLRGACQLFGCDGVLHSGKAEDMCGVCGGNGSSCSLVSQSYTGGQAREYATFLTLPMNATQIHIVNEAPVFTHMAVLVGGQYVVSGHGSMSMNVTHPSVLDDQRLEYRIYLTSDLLPYMEELKLPGPIREETRVQVYRRYGKEYGEQTSPNITYRYYAPGPSPDAGSAQLPRGSWASVPTPCSVTCSSGVQKHVYVCVDGDTRERLEKRFCEKAPPTTPQQTACHLPACPASWEPGEFGPCSAPCGGGEAVRPVRCVQRQGGDVVQVPSSECPPDSAPATIDSCNLQPCPARWQVSAPGECSAVCGPGEASRVVTCVRSEGGQDLEVDPSLCPQELRPPDSEACVVDVCPVGWESKGESLPTLKKTPGLLPRSGPPCPVYVWSPVIGQCSKTCGNGTLLVWFSCVDHRTRQATPEMHCESSSKPAPRSATCNPSPCPPTWHYKEGTCSVTCGGGVANRVLYCSRQSEEEEGEEEVVEDAECSASPKPTGVVSCNTNSCPARWRVQKTGACSVTCGLGVAQRSVTCVQFTQGRDGEVGEEACSVSGVKPATAVPCLLQLCTFTWEAKAWSQCSVSCGYGVQSRAVWCTGPSTLQPLNPMLCMHRPKPITIQGCRSDDCPQLPTHLPLHTSPPPLTTSQSAAPKTTPEVTASEETPFLAPPPLNPTETPRDPATTTPLPPHPSETTPPLTPPSTPKTSVCGQLLLQDSGTLDLTQVTGRCILSIGRPLDELIHIKVESSGLNCKKKEYVTFYDRLALTRKCGPMEGSVLTTRTNVLLVRQNLVTPGNGVLLTYSSQKNNKRSLHQGSCDVQLFGPSGIFENPTTPSVSDSHTCRVLINAPPSVKIRIQAQSMGLAGNSSSSQSTFIMIRDVDVLKTNVFSGQQLFLWLSSGSMAEIEFHGDYLRTPRSFTAEYSFTGP